jgi:phage baseplate assembly protein W
MAGAIKTPVFKDFDLNMKVHPITGKLIIRKNSESVKQAIRNLVLTDKGERPFRPLFGSDIRSRLFDLYDPATESNITSDVTLAIENYEERALLLGVGVAGDPDNNNLRVNVTFRTISSEIPNTLTLSLEAIR